MTRTVALLVDHLALLADRHGLRLEDFLMPLLGDRARATIHLAAERRCGPDGRAQEVAAEVAREIEEGWTPFAWEIVRRARALDLDAIVDGYSGDLERRLIEAVDE